MNTGLFHFLRNTGGTQKIVPLGVVSANVLGNAPRRVAIIFTAPTAGVATFGITNPVVSLEGISIAAGDSPVKLDLYKYGNLVTQQWFGIASAGTPNVAIYEVYAQEDSEHGEEKAFHRV